MADALGCPQTFLSCQSPKGTVLKSLISSLGAKMAETNPPLAIARDPNAQQNPKKKNKKTN